MRGGMEWSLQDPRTEGTRLPMSEGPSMSADTVAVNRRMEQQERRAAMNGSNERQHQQWDGPPGAPAVRAVTSLQG